MTDVTLIGVIIFGHDAPAQVVRVAEGLSLPNRLTCRGFDQLLDQSALKVDRWAQSANQDPQVSTRLWPASHKVSCWAAEVDLQ